MIRATVPAAPPSSSAVVDCYDILALALDAGIRDFTDGIYGNDPTAPYETAQQRQAEHLLDLAGCRRGSRLLDIGCGYGRILETAGRHGALARGITISPVQVGHCGAQGLDARLLDYRDLRERWPAAFDAAIANGSLEHFVAPQEAADGRADEIYRELFDIARDVLVETCDGGELGSQVLRLAGKHLTPRYRRALGRFRYGPGVFKVDWALDGPIPWNDSQCARAATVHVGGTFDEIAQHEAAVWHGKTSTRPFVLVAQHTLFDPSRAPPGKHTAWAYCHVPHGSNVDMLTAIELQIERFAAGFRDRILARHVATPERLERHNANCVGGDITGGSQDFGQLFARPVAQWRPYRTSNKRIHICSASTPPGDGVHGMCGYYAVQVAWNDCCQRHR